MWHHCRAAAAITSKQTAKQPMIWKSIRNKLLGGQMPVNRFDRLLN